MEFLDKLNGMSEAVAAAHDQLVNQELRLKDMEACLVEIYGALNQMGSLIEDLSRRLALIEKDRLEATEKVSKIFMPN